MKGRASDRGANPALSPEALLQVSEGIAAAGPRKWLAARESELVLLAVDPFRAHVYWHLDGGDLFQTRLRCGDPCSTLCLRLHQSAPGTHMDGRYVEFPVEGLSSRRYVESDTGGLAVFAELGVKAGDGSFHPMVVSDRLELPRDRESPHYEMVPVDTRERIRVRSAAIPGAGMEGPLPLPGTTLDRGGSPGSAFRPVPGREG